MNMVYMISYMMICGGWTFLAKNNLYISQDSVINFTSLLIGCAYFNVIYVSIIQRKSSKVMARALWFIIPILFISVTILKDYTFEAIIIMLVSLFILLIANLRLKSDKIYFWSIACLFLSVALYYYDFRVLFAILAFTSIVLDTNWKYGYKRMSSINIMPISKEYQKQILPILIIFLTLILFFLGFKTIEINIVFHMITISYTIFLIINIENSSKSYKDMESFYLVATYIMDERNEFSRLIHDEIIQDVEASKNILKLKKPDIFHSTEILTALEMKLRKIMNYYSANTFTEYTVAENIDNIIASINALYPKKQTRVEIYVHKNVIEFLKKEQYHVVLQISKELINNIYKHSDARYIKLGISLDRNNTLIIFCESDGANRTDYERIDKSKGGVLILKILVKKNMGTIEYIYKEGILYTEISLNLGVLNETNYNR